MPDKPLFIPLKTEWFQAFADGIKTVELRPYGKRWNERVCREGREVLLSKGYGKAHRLRGVINLFRKMRADELLPGHRKAILDCYGTLDMDVAVIGIRVEKNPLASPSGPLERLHPIWQLEDAPKLD